MDVPDWIDTDIVYSFGYWLLTAGVWIAFLIGFKGADSGLFGIADAGGMGIPLWTKVTLILLTPVISYIIYGRVALR